MFDLIKRLLANDKIRYLIAGGVATFVNIISFFALRSFTGIERNVCNIIAIIMAMIFAYVANKLFVFRSKTGSVSKAIGEAVTFFSARIISMAVEVLGFAILCDTFRMPEIISKFIIQFFVLVLNYMFSKLFVFKKGRRGFKEWLADNRLYVLSFFVVFVFMTAVAISLKAAPFGNNSFTLVDSLHQYLPFYGEYRDKLLNEGSLFYTWNLALGSNFMSLSAYYLSSPFNYLFLLGPKMAIPAFVTLILILKLSFSAVSMAYLLANRGGHESKDIKIVAIAVAYALNNYMIGYNWNFMWLDCIMIFPLIILGFERLMEKGDPKMYVLSLFYSLYCNYYIGFMICIFMILWFLIYRHKGIKRFFVHGVKFAFYSIISAGISAFLLIPAFKGIMATASANAELPGWEWYGSVFELLKQSFIMTEPINCQIFDGGVNLYCGTFALFAIFLYVFNGNIRFTEKLGKILVIAFLLVSFNSEKLNFIWHGFHNQYGIPNRFSFLYIFLLLLISYDAVKRTSKMSVPYIISAGFLTGTFTIYCSMEATEELKKLTLLATMGLLLAYVIILGLRAGFVISRKVFSVIFAIAFCAEILVNASWGFGENGYASLQYYDSTPTVSAANNRIKELAEEENAGFYRSELMEHEVLDEATWHQMPSVGTFCSTVLGEVVTVMGRLGFYTGANEFLYMGSTPFTNSILNVRYLLEREDDFNHFNFDYIETVENVAIYENPYPLALGFVVSEDVKNWMRDGSSGSINQSNLAHAMTGLSGFFSSATVASVVSSDSCDIVSNGNSVTFTPRQAGDVSFMVSFNCECSGDYYITCKGSGITKIRFYINGNEIAYDRYQSQMFHLGQLDSDDCVSVEYVYKNANT
ncbi:MAG: YfhO family protein, partial [Wujia sp.]